MKTLVQRYMLLLKALVTIACLVPLVMATQSAEADTATHLVISEVQVAGGTVDDEFIELYNPTGLAISIEDWSIQFRRASTGTFVKKHFGSGDSVPAYGFFLIANNAYDEVGTPADMSHNSFTMANSGGSVFLVNSQTLLTSCDAASIADKVAYGTGTYLCPESAAASAPAANGSIERKPGAAQSDKGNGEDTENNSADFDTRTISEPQNTSSSTEQPPTAITLSSFTACSFKPLNWVKVIAFTLAGLVAAGAQYFLVYEDAPRPLRILAPSIFAISLIIIGFMAGRG